MQDIDFWMDFVAGNSNKLQKIGFGRKNQLSPQCVHLLNLEFFNSGNVKNKERVHT